MNKNNLILRYVFFFLGWPSIPSALRSLQKAL